MNLEEYLRLHIKPRLISFSGDSISSFKKLAVTAFGVGLSTVSKSIRQVCHAIAKVLGPQLIKFTTTAEGLKELIQRFESKFGFPLVVSCIDQTHMPIKQPNENAHDYFCNKMKYKLSVQAVGDENGCFLDVDCSWPGSVHDAKVFSNSYINKLFQKSKLRKIERKLSEDDTCSVGPVLIGDPAYPLLLGPMGPFSRGRLFAKMRF